MRKMKKILIGLTVLFFIGCGGGGSSVSNVSGDTTAPSVSKTSPIVNGNSIPVMTTVSAVFSENVDPATLNTETFTITSSFGTVSGTVVCTGSTATFLPDTPLEYDNTYTVKLTRGVKDIAGNPLASEYSWNFTTVAAGPGDPDNYMPFTQGNTWTFEGVITESGMEPVNYINTLRIDGTYEVDGKTASVFIESNSLGDEIEAYLYKDLNGVTTYGESNLNDPITSKIVPYQEINFPALPGYSYVPVHKANLDYGMDLDLDGINESADILAWVNVVGFETLTVPAGTFTDAIKIESDILLTLRMSKNGSIFSVHGVTTHWYAANVGVVKRTSVYTETDGPTRTVEEKLTGHNIILAGNLATADSNTEAPGKPAVGYDGTNFLVVTRRVVLEFDSTMIGMLVTESGEVLNTFDIATADTGGYLTSNRADVAFDGNNYLVVFGQNGQIAGQRVDPNGQVLDGPSGFPITTTDTNGHPVVAFDGTNFLVVWQKYINNSYDIYGTRVSPDGQVLGEFLIFTATGEQISPTIAFDGNNSLVLWRDTRSGSGPSDDTDIYGIRVTPEDVVLDPLGIPVCNAGGIQDTPVLAFDGNNYFAVWTDGRMYEGSIGQIPGFDIYGARIATDGTVLDVDGIAINTVQYMDFNGKANPSITFDGSNYFVAWQTGSYINHPPAGIFATWVSPSGQVITKDMGEDGLSISGPPSGYWYPSSPYPSSSYFYPVTELGTNNMFVIWMNERDLNSIGKNILGALLPVQ